MQLEGKRVLVTGGTGSLGKTLVRRLLGGEMGTPETITVFSRDEAKQHEMRLAYLRRHASTDDVIYRNGRDVLRFRIGDVRDLRAVRAALDDVHVVFNAAALKQVPTAEYFPAEAVQTNILGAQNLVDVIRHDRTAVELVVGISTDKACKPVNVMGMTKAIQERVFVQANLECATTSFACVRYGNVLASRGSVVPMFVDQVRRGGPVTITMAEMTRFLLSLDRAVDTVFAAVRHGRRGETWIPKVPAARVVDVAAAIIAGRDIPITFTGMRPGEKLHEILVSEEECFRTFDRDGYYVIQPLLPELRDGADHGAPLAQEYSSRAVNLGVDEIGDLLAGHLASMASVTSP